MKNFSTIIIGCAFLVVAILVVVIGLKFFERQQTLKDQALYQQYVQKYRTQQLAKPSASPTPSASSEASASDLNSELDRIQDDGGASDFNQAQADINNL